MNLSSPTPFSPVIPAKAGTHFEVALADVPGLRERKIKMGPSVRWDDEPNSNDEPQGTDLVRGSPTPYSPLPIPGL